MRDRNKKYIYIVAAAGFLIAMMMSFCLGAARLTPMELLDAVKRGPASGLAGNIFWYVRLPRTAACLLAGAGLSVSGAVIQGVLANQLASPSIIGVNAGAGLAVTICCAAGTVSGWGIAGASFLGALIAVMLVVFTAQKTNASRTTVILGGVAVNSILNAASEAITTLVPEVGIMSADYRVGGFSAVTSARVFPAGIIIVGAILILLTLCNELDLMNLGEETAQGLGMPVKRMRTVFLILAALLAGASVSFAGLLGFIGLIVPHMVRKIAGSESRYLLPLSALFGGAFVTVCDVAARLIFEPYELPVGILMAFIGGPFFVFLLFKSRGGKSHG